jgi:hypothetical protein
LLDNQEENDKQNQADRINRANHLGSGLFWMLPFLVQLFNQEASPAKARITGHIHLAFAISILDLL